ncbi:hypothetical protein LMG26411_05238 [Cupriavidus numazuensis]|uniref:DUF1269 domain-containing protein n=2 Tax=Cupriavidus numazuensis TaxID=221992 RepID=A0ABN7Q9V9_9BURK|nr:hypothetical protein LMG26411_05238 [Cupriavidus numazuensis]
MDRMLVVVFDDETRAYEGKVALHALADEGSVGIYAEAIVTKNADGTAALNQVGDATCFETLTGTVVGSLIGLLAGPGGMVLGAAAGMGLGACSDLSDLSLGSDFISDVTNAMTPGKVALVAEIEEEWTTPVDLRMEALGGTVLRRSVADVRDKIHDEHVAAMKADLAQMKAEHACAKADRKAKLQAKVEGLEAKVQTQMQNARLRRDAAAVKAQVKADVMAVQAERARDQVVEA